MDTVLRLGEFEFQGMEVPDALGLGGAQVLAKHWFPGGAKTVQALGADHAPIGWAGLFLGETALDRARYLDFLRCQGGELQFTVFDLTYTVVIERFQFSAERFYKVPYQISLEVVSDDSQPQRTIAPASFDTAIQDDSYAMLGLGDLIGDGPLSAALASLDGAIGTVSSFAKANGAVIQSVINSVGAVSSRVALLTASAENTLLSATTLGGVLPSNPLSASVANMAAQLTVTNRYPLLLNINSLATRMTRNVGMANLQSSTRTRQVAGGNLFDIAAREYGDATRWTAIAEASGLDDTVVSGLQTLLVPANPQDSGGVPLQ